MDASCARKQLRELSSKRDAIYQHLFSFRLPLVDGCLIQRHRKCGKKGCSCRQGEGHGPYLYLVTRKDGRACWSYLGKASHGPLAEAVRRHQYFLKLVKELRDVRQQEEACLTELEQALMVVPSSLAGKRLKKEVAA